MAFWTNTFLNKMREEWLRRIYKVQYQAGNTWYDAVITDRRVVGNTVKITTTTNDNAAMVIKAVRLIDTGGDVAGQRTENITKQASQGIVTVWEFPIYELTD